MNLHDTTNFKATALEEDTLHRLAPSIYAIGIYTCGGDFCAAGLNN
jgi:hypothetical protein